MDAIMVTTNYYYIYCSKSSPHASVFFLIPTTTMAAIFDYSSSRCGYGGDLLCCETCSCVYHSSCLDNPPQRLQDLFCEICKQEAMEKSKGPVEVCGW